MRHWFGVFSFMAIFISQESQETKKKQLFSYLSFFLPTFIFFKYQFQFWFSPKNKEYSKNTYL